MNCQNASCSSLNYISSSQGPLADLSGTIHTIHDYLLNFYNFQGWANLIVLACKSNSFETVQHKETDWLPYDTSMFCV